MKIEAFDEFGYILWYYAPISYDAFLKGKLISTKSKIGTKPVFYFSENHTEDEIHYDPPMLKKTLQPIEHFTSCYKIEGPLFIKDNWTPPPYKKIFKNDVYVYDKPILTINNKNTKEWGQHPHNYFNSDFLNKIFTELKSKYQIIYIRPPDKSENFKLQKDTNQISLDIGDKEILRNHPEVIDIETLLLKSDKVYNDLNHLHKSLRYGKILFMTDQDLDGSHIKGLGINLFHNLWKSIIKLNVIGFMNTPILKAKKGSQEVVFYNDGEEGNNEE